MTPLSEKRMYWAAIVKAPAGEWPKKSAEQIRRDLLARVANWHDPVVNYVAETPLESLIATDLYDRPPLKSWTRGRVTFLGDAAHPVTPFLGQGANMALEDAWALSEAIEREATIESALSAYANERQGRTTKIVEISRQIGMTARFDNPLLLKAFGLMERALAPFINMEKSERWLYDYRPFSS